MATEEENRQKRQNLWMAMSHSDRLAVIGAMQCEHPEWTLARVVHWCRGRVGDGRQETEWLEIEKEPGTPAWLFANYVVYLAAIPPIAGFIGGSLIGITVPPMGTFRVPLFAGLLGAVITYLLNFVIVYAVAIIIGQLAPRFGGRKDFANALKVAVYCFTPYWVGGIFGLIAGTRFLAYVIGLFGVYLLSLGLPRLMKSPAEKSAGYFRRSGDCRNGLCIRYGADFFSSAERCQTRRLVPYG